jgi:hypothetical protein
VPKVKEEAAVTGVRNAKKTKKLPDKKAKKAVKVTASKPNARSKVAPKRAAKRGKTVSRSGKQAPANKARATKKARAAKKAPATKKVASARKAPMKTTTKSTRRIAPKLALTRGRKPEVKPDVKVSIKPLDPQLKCGPDTSVQFLYRVDEAVDGRSTPHLVFFDQHGWYCEHGRSCPAVGYAMKYNGQIARVS